MRNMFFGMIRVKYEDFFLIAYLILVITFSLDAADLADVK